jgi:hypothetical protein
MILSRIVTPGLKAVGRKFMLGRAGAAELDLGLFFDLLQLEYLWALPVASQQSLQ